MKQMSLTLLRVFTLLVGLMVWQTKSADAHCIDHPATYEASAQSTHIKSETSALKAEIVIVKAASVASLSQEDNCKDGCCCSMGGGCCTATALPPHSLNANILVRDAFEIDLPELSLPQGPPSSLLRPPRLSA